MRLTELEPEFAKRTENGWRNDIAMSEADGLWFLCPKCFAANTGPVGTHGVMCWKPSVPQSILPTPGRWDQTGSGFGDLTLVAGSSSVQLVGGCNAHFHIVNGEIVNLT